MKATKIAARSLLQVLGVFALLWTVGCTPPGEAALLDGEALLEEGEYRAAIKKLRKAADILTENPDAWNFLGLAYHRDAQPEQAVKAYQQALRLNVDHLSARYNLGCLLLENGQFKLAEDQFKTYEILDDSKPEVNVKIGLAQLGDKRLTEARQSFEAALKQSRAFPEAWNGLGLIRLEQNSAVDAYHYFNTAIEQNENYGPAYLNQAVVAHQYLHDLPLALQKYRRFLFLEPQSPRVPELKSLTARIEEAIRPKPRVIPEPKEVAVEEEEKPDDQAEETVAVAVVDEGAEEKETVPSVPEETKGDEGAETKPVEVASSTEQEQKPKTGVGSSDDKSLKQTAPINVASSETEEIEKPSPTVVKVDPKYIAPRSEAEPGNVVESPSFETIEVTPQEYEFKVADEQPENISSRDLSNEGWRTVSTRRAGLGISVGRQMFRNKDGTTSSSGENVQTGDVTRVPSVPYRYRNPTQPIRGNRRQADPFFQKGNQAFRSGRESEAILAYREAVSRDPAFFEAHYNMGLAAIKAGLAETALDAYEVALAIDPSNRNARYNFALALEQGLHHAEAASALESLLGNHPDDVNAHFTLATLYAKKIGNAALAKSHYERVLQLDPNFPKAVSIRYWLSAAD